MNSKTVYSHIISYTITLASDLVLLAVNLFNFIAVTSTLTVVTFALNCISETLLCYVFLSMVKDLRTPQVSDD